MANEVLKELKYNGKKVISEVARRDALGRTINITYATKDEIIFEKITINLSSTGETSLDITGYSQLWLEILGSYMSGATAVNIGKMSGSSKIKILNLPIAELNGMFHAMVCITINNSLINIVAYYNNATTVPRVISDHSTPSNTIYFEAPGITSSSNLDIIGFAIKEI